MFELYALWNSCGGAIGALSWGMLKSLVPIPVPDSPSTGVRGSEKSTGAVRGALAKPPVNEFAKVLFLGVGGIACEDGCWEGEGRNGYRGSKPGRPDG